MPKIKVTDIDADASTSAKGLVQLTGCLGGTATAPTVVALRESGGVTLPIGAVAAGQFLKRSGSNFVGSDSLFAQASTGGVVSAYVFAQGFSINIQGLNWQAGDYCLLGGHAYSDNDAYSIPSGFTEIFKQTSGSTSAVWGKFLNGTETTISLFTDNTRWFCVFVRGVNTTTPVNTSNITAYTSQTTTFYTTTCTTTSASIIVKIVNIAGPFSPEPSLTAPYSVTPYVNSRGTAIWIGDQDVAGLVTSDYATSSGSTFNCMKLAIGLNKLSWVSTDVPKTVDTPVVKTDTNRLHYKTDGHLLYLTEANSVKTVGHPVKYKTADESVSSSTALQNDDHLTFAIGANEIWEFDIDAPITVGVGGIKVSVNAPASPTGFTADMQILDGTTTVAMSRITTADTALENAGALTTGRVKIHGVIENGANAGNVVFRFAQQASDAANTTVKKYSTITYRKIG